MKSASLHQRIQKSGTNLHASLAAVAFLPRFFSLLWLLIAILVLQSSVASAQSLPADEGHSTSVQQPDPASSETAHRLEWQWKRVHAAEIGATAVLALGAIGFYRMTAPTARWQKVNGFDGWFRDQLRLSGQARQGVDLASRILATSLFAYPLLVDSFGVVLIGDKNKDVFTQLFAIQAQAFAMTGFVTYAAKAGARRERPYGQGVNCPGPSPECREGINESFFSDTASFAFAGAGLTCVAHRHLALYGRVGDPLACATTLTLASAAALFRVMADEHWMTDVLTGAGIGLLAGWLVPWLLHFRHDETKGTDGLLGALRYAAPYGTQGEFGLRITGRF
jgi:membrane-associated phospholipid phosphatase